MLRHHLLFALAAAAAALAGSTNSPAAPYVPVVIPPGAMPAVGPGVMAPKEVFGKEYSRDADEDFVGAADAERVVAWDGIGGTANGLDYTGTRTNPPFPREQQVDALAHSRDALFNALREDRAHLIFSHDDEIAVFPPGGGPMFAPSVPLLGPVLLANGNTINGAAEISVEESGVYSSAPPELQYGWAMVAEIQDTTMAPPSDLDGLEVWGPEPGFTADANKYSLEDDIVAGAGTSVFSYDLTGGFSAPYIPHATIVTAVESLLGIVPSTGFNRLNQPGREAINLDALMVNDVDGVELQFGGVGDSIIFSINQVVDPADPDGYYATGSELFVLEATAAGLSASFLKHGGHAWDHAYTLGALALPLPDQRAVIDINAIEAVGELVVPEPTGATLLSMAAIALLAPWRQRFIARSIR